MIDNPNASGARAATRVLDRRLFQIGQMIFRADEPGSHAFLIKRGAVDIYKVHDGQEIVIATLGANEIFGEMALFNTGRRSTNARAAGPTECVVLTTGNLEKLLEDATPGVAALMRTLVRRLTELNDRIEVCPETGRFRIPAA
ncbi:MAG: cyclic nucleotide-binding domain-containing protein [Proteobacteria bacterium]|nr:cyclic nucleotide-binding domain-containing protein [Pseudomonadota bacterium]MBI3499457.1 cyclic nucleotide-binding domain-containing protein [Pseudomonadota bacterium]